MTGCVGSVVNTLRFMNRLHKTKVVVVPYAYLGKIFSIRYFEIFFLFFPENRF